MGWTTLNTVDFAADTPHLASQDQAIVNDLNDLDSRVNAALALCDSNIFDDFAYKTATLRTDIWEIGNHGASDPVHVATGGNHLVEFHGVASAQTQSGIAAAAGRIRVYLGADQHVVFESRLKFVGPGTGGRRVLCGLQDASFLPTGGLPHSFLTDVTDFIGFIQGTNDNTLKFTIQKGGVSGASQDNLGPFTSWSTVKIDIVRASAVFTIHAYINGSEIGGSPFSTNVPDTTILRPAMAVGNDTGSGLDIWVNADRIRCYFGALPDSP